MSIIIIYAISRNPFGHISIEDFPEQCAREAQALLKQNGDAGLGQSQLRYQWSAEALLSLTTGFEKRMPAPKITSLIYESVNGDFNVQRKRRRR
jgi:hypothetical protein